MQKNLDKVYDNIYKVIPLLEYNHPKLNNVLKWHTLNGRDRHSYFVVTKGVAYFVMYHRDEREKFIWDLSKEYLHEQSDELIEWLASLI